MMLHYLSERLWRSFFIGLIIFLAVGLLQLLVVAALIIDIDYFHNSVGEISLTELSQEIMLFIMMLLFLSLACVYPRKSYSYILIGGFFGCLLIRELDFLFDNIFYHGAWLPFAVLLALVCIGYALSQPKYALLGLVVFMHQRSYGLMCAGLAILLVFSRLIGMEALWINLLQQGYARVVKNVIEEGCELAGYSLCFAATIWHCAECYLAQRVGLPLSTKAQINKATLYLRDES